MQIRSKLIYGSIALAIVPVAITALVIGQVATTSAGHALDEQARNQLITIRDTKKDQIEAYFSRIENQAITLAQSQTVEAGLLSRYRATVYEDVDVASVEKMRAELNTVYAKEFVPEFEQLNPNEVFDLGLVLSGMSSAAIAMQHGFAANPDFDLNTTEQMLAPGDRSMYALQHKAFHPVLLDYAHRFDYRDIYLVDPNTGRIIYSKGKGIDFGTSLIDGPFANSGLGDIFKQAREQKDKQTVAFSDFKPYLPNFNRPTAFVGIPVFKKSRLQGVLILSLSSKSINRIMTYDFQWKKVGLGDTGEVYLVGTDKLMRSDARFLVEDRKNYLAAVNSIGMPEEALARIGQHNTTVGLQTVDTLTGNLALDNKVGFDVIDDYRGIPVLSAYAPIDILGTRWGILAEIDVAEQTAPQSALTKSIGLSAFWVAGGLIGVAMIFGLLLARSVTSRLTALNSRMEEISHGSGDLTSTLSEQGNDEISKLAAGFNHFVQKIKGVIDLACEASQALANEAGQMSVRSKTVQDTVDNQQQQIHKVSSAIDEMSQSMGTIADNTSAAASSAKDAQQAAEQGNNVVRETVGAINTLADGVQDAADTVEKLAEESKNIESILSIIHSISEQTNLLALNAAIEAARAGESGRGFAVVADEVRSLSVQIQKETGNIGGKIEQLQTEADKAVGIIKDSRKAAQQSVTAAESAGQELQSIMQSVETITTMTAQIARGVEDQHNNSSVINDNIISINAHAQDASQAANVATETSHELSLMAGQLQGLIQQFLLSDIEDNSTNGDTDQQHDEVLF